jgi:hypothetical protein
MQKDFMLQYWQELYDLTLEIKKAEPWKYLWDADILQIKLPNEEEPYFISILGRNEDTYGIVVYPGYESFKSFIELSNADKLGMSSMYAMYEQDNLTCYFGNREEVSPEQYQIIRDLSLRFRGKNQWPYFLSMKPQFIPYMINTKEVQQLIQVYRELIPLLEYIQTQPLQLEEHFEKGETITRYYDPKDKDWKYRISKPKTVEKTYATVSLDSNHPMLQEMLSIPKNDSVIEIDMNYIHTTIDGTKDGFTRPINPKLLVFIDQTSGMVLEQAMITPKVKEEEMILSTLLDYIAKNNRPKAIHFKLPVIGFLFQSFCAQIQVPLIQNKRLPLSQEFFNDISQYFGK